MVAHTTMCSTTPMASQIERMSIRLNHRRRRPGRSAVARYQKASSKMGAPTSKSHVASVPA
jgi:hypothetical protein